MNFASTEVSHSLQHDVVFVRSSTVFPLVELLNLEVQDGSSSRPTPLLASFPFCCREGTCTVYIEARQRKLCFQTSVLVGRVRRYGVNGNSACLVGSRNRFLCSS